MDYSGYAFSFLKRRLSFIVKQLSVKSKEDFINRLGDKSFRENVISLLDVENTEMFRDPSFWTTLRDKVIDSLPSDCKYLWIPQETNGEEAFSLSILLHEANLNEKYRIICNTYSEINCNKIKQGVLNPLHLESNMANYSSLEFNSRYCDFFDSNDDKLAVSSKVLDPLECRLGHYKTDSPDNGSIGLVLFRNISVYYNRRLAESAFKMLINKLMPGGYLAIGVKEELPPALKEELIPVHHTEKIYQKPSYPNSIRNVVRGSNI